MKTLTYTMTFIRLRLRPLLWPAVMLLLAIAMFGCRGAPSAMVKPIPSALTTLAEAADGRIRVSVDALRVAPLDTVSRTTLDRYRLTIENVGAANVRIEQALVIDAFNQGIAPASPPQLHTRRKGAAELEPTIGSPLPVRIREDRSVRNDPVAVEQVSMTDVGTIASGLLVVGSMLKTSRTATGTRMRRFSNLLRHEAEIFPFDLSSHEAVSLELLFPRIPAPRKLVVVYRCVDVLRHVTIDISSVVTEIPQFYSAGVL